MDFRTYQEAAARTASYPQRGGSYTYPLMGLMGEVGELVEKLKKYWRNDGKIYIPDFTEEDKKVIAAEAGDILWYLAMVLKEFKLDLNQVAHENLDKLEDRAARGVIKSQGDTR